MIAVPLLAGCPSSESGSTGSGTETGGEAAAPRSAEVAIPPDPEALSVSTGQLKLGQRMQITVPGDPGEGRYLLKVMKTQQDDTGKVVQIEQDSFEPVTGPDSMNGWLPPKTGKYSVMLEDGQGNVVDSEKVTVTAWPKGDPIEQVPPFVTINAAEVTEEMQLEVGLPLVAYWLVPDDFPHDGWIGLFLYDGNFEGSATADDAVDSALLSGNKGQFTFWPKEPGRYLVRMFASSDIAASHVADSQEITVVPEPDTE